MSKSHNKVRLEIDVPVYVRDWLRTNEAGKSAEESAVEVLEMIVVDSEFAERGNYPIQ